MVVIERNKAIEKVLETYDRAFVDGLAAFAYLIGEEEFERLNGKNIKNAIDNFKSLGNYSPPKFD